MVFGKLESTKRQLGLDGFGFTDPDDFESARVPVWIDSE